MDNSDFNPMQAPFGWSPFAAMVLVDALRAAGEWAAIVALEPSDRVLLLLGAIIRQTDAGLLPRQCRNAALVLLDMLAQTEWFWPENLKLARTFGRPALSSWPLEWQVGLVARVIDLWPTKVGKAGPRVEDAILAALDQALAESDAPAL